MDNKNPQTENNESFKVVDHALTLFYYIEDSSQSTEYVRNADMLDFNKENFPEYIVNRLTKSSKDVQRKKKIWEPFVYKPSADIHNTFKELFGPNKSSLIQCFKLNTEIIRGLNGNSNISNSHAKHTDFFLKPSKSAIKRIKESIHQNGNEDTPKDNQKDKEMVLPIEITNLSYFHFKLKSAVMMLEIKIGAGIAHDIIEIMEGIDAFSRFSDLYWQDSQDKLKKHYLLKLKKRNESKSIEPKFSPYNFSMGDLVRSLVLSPMVENDRRVYTYCYMKIESENKQEITPSLKKIQFRLTKQINNDYEILDDAIEEGAIQEYTNVRHQILYQGSTCIVLANENTAPYIQGYYQQSILKTIIPLHLISFFTENGLNKFDRFNSNWIQDHKNIKEDDIGKINEHIDMLINFDLTFFKRVVSKISLHNQVYQRLILCKSLAERHEAHTQKIEKLRYYIDTSRSRRYCRIMGVGIVIASFISTHTFFNIIAPIILKYKFNFLNDHIDLYGIAISAIAAFITTCVVYGKCGK